VALSEQVYLHSIAKEIGAEDMIAMIQRQPIIHIMTL
jgi:hypothetical protein